MPQSESEFALELEEISEDGEDGNTQELGEAIAATESNPVVFYRRPSVKTSAYQDNSRKTTTRRARGRDALLEELENCIVQKHGHVVRGWLLELDPGGCLSCSFDDFCAAASNIGYKGDIMGIFAGVGTLTLADLCLEIADTIVRMRDWVGPKFGGVMELFDALDESGDGQLDQGEFTDACRKHGFDSTEDTIGEIFKGLDNDASGFITKDNIIYLEGEKDERTLLLNVLAAEKQESMGHLMQVGCFNLSELEPPKTKRIAQRTKHREWHTDIDFSPAMTWRERQRRTRDLHKTMLTALTLFREHLVFCYGHEVRGWRRALDPEGAHNLTPKKLAAYCVKVDFRGNVACLRRALDRDTDGTCGMEELTPGFANSLALFRLWAHQNFGSCTRLWDEPRLQKAIKHVPKKIRICDFITVTSGLGFGRELDAESRSQEMRNITAALDFDGCGLIRLDDLVWLDSWPAPGWLAARPDHPAAEKLKELLIEKYGNFIQAWRRALDTDSSNRVSWSEFQEACSRVNFKGSVAGAWRALDRDLSGWISLNEVDPHSHELLTSFKHWSEKRFGSVEAAFRALDQDKSKTLTFSELKLAIKTLGWDGNARELFDGLDTKQAEGASGSKEKRRDIELDEVAFLDDYNDDVHRANQYVDLRPFGIKRDRSVRDVTHQARETLAFHCTRSKEELTICRYVDANSTPYTPLSQSANTSTTLSQSIMSQSSWSTVSPFSLASLKGLAKPPSSSQSRRRQPLAKSTSTPVVNRSSARPKLDSSSPIRRREVRGRPRTPSVKSLAMQKDSWTDGGFHERVPAMEGGTCAASLRIARPKY
jgi:Ca2+-binding EF-hand superfamily protein